MLSMHLYNRINDASCGLIVQMILPDEHAYVVMIKSEFDGALFESGGF